MDGNRAVFIGLLAGDKKMAACAGGVADRVYLLGRKSLLALVCYARRSYRPVCVSGRVLGGIGGVRKILQGQGLPAFYYRADSVGGGGDAARVVLRWCCVAIFGT